MIATHLYVALGDIERCYGRMREATRESATNEGFGIVRAVVRYGAQVAMCRTSMYFTGHTGRTNAPCVPLCCGTLRHSSMIMRKRLV